MKRISPIIAIFFLFNACFDQDECLITSTNLVKVELATVAGVDQNIRFISVQQDSVSTPSTHYYFPYFEGYPLGELSLPVDPDHDTSYYSFETSDSVRLKLALTYTSYSRVISTTCGAFLYYKDLAVVANATTFDSTQVIQPQLFIKVPTNVKVLF